MSTAKTLLGIGAVLGAGAAFKHFVIDPRAAAKPGTPSAPPAPDAPDAPPPAPGEAPAAPPDAPAFKVVDLGNPLTAKNGHHYRSRLQLDGIKAALARGNPTLVNEQLLDLGLKDVHVYKFGDALPADWPAETVENATRDTYFAEGTWNLPDQNLARLPEMKLAWEQ